MNRITHPIEPEELMAFLDGELPAEQTAATAMHVGECEECQRAVANLKSISHSLKAWHVQVPDSEFNSGIANALATREARREPAKTASRGFKRFLHWPRIAWVAGLATVGAVIVIGVATPNLMRARYAPQPQTMAARVRLEPTGPAVPATRSSDKSEVMAYLSVPSEQEHRGGGGGGGGDRDSLVAGPMVVRTADLQLITKEFDKARVGMEAILKKHRGYVGDLKVGGATGSGRTLTASLRVPAGELEATLNELKSLGRIQSESQGGQDVTSQYVDLQARLANSRNTEKRLTDLLAQRTGKLADVLEVEQEVDRVRGEIEQMEAESKQLTKQVSFATMSVTITEDYKSQLEIVPPSTSTRLSNAAVEGYRSMVDGVLSVALFALSNGPSFVLWAAVLFVPARFAWKVMRRRVAGQCSRGDSI